MGAGNHPMKREFRALMRRAMADVARPLICGSCRGKKWADGQQCQRCRGKGFTEIGHIKR